MRDDPTGERLLATAEALLRDRLLPALPGNLRTDALMIARAMAIAARQLHDGEAEEREELESLRGLVEWPAEPDSTLRSALLAANHALCQAIRRGEADTGERRERVLIHLHRVTRQKLAESNPKRLADAP